jgi:hypothetical protein
VAAGILAGKRHRRTLVLVGLGCLFPSLAGALEPAAPAPAPAPVLPSPLSLRFPSARKQSRKKMHEPGNTRTCSWTHLGSTVQNRSSPCSGSVWGRTKQRGRTRAAYKQVAPPAESNMSNSETGLGFAYGIRILGLKNRGPNHGGRLRNWDPVVVWRSGELVLLGQCCCSAC